jgi:cephalosporin hydroxylase
MATTMKAVLLGTLFLSLNACTQNESELIGAVENRQPDTVKELLDRGVDLESTNQDGATALIVAAFEGYTEVVQSLVNAGADIDARNNQGLTPLMAAVTRGHSDIVQVLLTRPELPQEYLSFQKNITDTFHIISYLDTRTWPSNTWFGISAWQNPNDIWITQEIISEIKPDYIIETGTFHGGSAVLWATILDQVNPDGRVITIDVEDLSSEARKLSIAQRKVDFILGSSTDPEIIKHLTEEVSGKKVLVILDSLHAKEHVYQELKLYSPLVSVGSYLIVQDTNVNGNPVFVQHGPGPMEATRQFLSEVDNFQSDKTRERLLFTMHPDGYLKRSQ